MKAKSLNIPLRELFKGYINNDEEGVWAYDGKLCVRPSYQRDPERVYGLPFSGFDIRFSVSDRTINLEVSTPQISTFP